MEVAGDEGGGTFPGGDFVESEKPRHRGSRSFPVQRGSPPTNEVTQPRKELIVPVQCPIEMSLGEVEAGMTEPSGMAPRTRRTAALIFAKQHE